jgi:hypothetical protein
MHSTHLRALPCLRARAWRDERWRTAPASDSAVDQSALGDGASVASASRVVSLIGVSGNTTTSPLVEGSPLDILLRRCDPGCRVDTWRAQTDPAVRTRATPSRCDALTLRCGARRRRMSHRPRASRSPISGHSWPAYAARQGRPRYPTGPRREPMLRSRAVSGQQAGGRAAAHRRHRLRRRTRRRRCCWYSV